MLLASGFIAGRGGKLESGGFIETAESGRASRLIEKELPIVGGSTFTLIFSSDTLSANDPEFRAAVEAALVPLRTDPRKDSIITPYDTSVVDALIPLGTGLLAVMSGIAGMFVLSHITGVSVYAQNVVTLIGLGVAIDYSLFVTSRFREELKRGRGREDALAIAMSTSGRAVTFSGITVAIGLSGMLFYEGTFLPSMGLAGAIVVASAVFYGLTFLPALLALLGPRIDRLRVPILQPDQSGRGWWHTIATAVMRRPIAVLVPVVAFILLAGSPFLHLRLASSDVRTLPTHEESRAAYDKLLNDFPGAGQNPVQVIVSYASGGPLDRTRVPQLQDLSARLAKLPGVVQVQSAFSIDPRVFGGQVPDLATIYSLPREQLPAQLQTALRQTVGQHIVLFDVVSSYQLYSDDARQLVRDIRADTPPTGGGPLGTGFPAIDLDTVNFIVGHTPQAVAFVMLATMVALFVLLGSVELPIKAMVT